MNFFCTKKHYENWTRNQDCKPEEIFCLDMHEALMVAEMLFKVETFGPDSCS
jgi:hypothetical protein